MSRIDSSERKSALDPNKDPGIELLKVVSPPQGMKLERFVAMSYSLDARLALSLLCSAYGVSDGSDVRETRATGLNNIHQKKWIKSILEKSMFLVQTKEKNQIHDFEQIEPWLGAALLDRSCIIGRKRIHSRGAHPWVNFHPKLILAEFNSPTESIIRIYIGSKNLSLGSAIECGLAAEFSTRNRAGSVRTEGLKQIASFISGIKKQGLRDETADCRRFHQHLEGWKRSLGRLAGTHKYLTSVTDNSFGSAISSIEFFGQVPGEPTALAERIIADLMNSVRARIVSPWLDAPTVAITARALDESDGLKSLEYWILKSEEHHLAPLSEDKRAKLVVSEASDSLYGREAEDELDNFHRNYTLHAKIYAFDFPNKNGALWLGSANFTAPGIGLLKSKGVDGMESPLDLNFELMARIGLKSRAVSLLGSPRLGPINSNDFDPVKGEPETNEERFSRILGEIEVAWRPFGRLMKVSIKTSAATLKILKTMGRIEIRVAHILDRPTDGEKKEVRTEFVTISGFSGKELASDGHISIPVELKHPPDTITAQAKLVVSTKTISLEVEKIIPLPDRQAKARIESLGDRIEVGFNDILRSIEEIGEKPRWGQKGHGGGGGGGGYDHQIDILGMRLDSLILKWTGGSKFNLTTCASDLDEHIDELEAWMKKNVVRDEHLALIKSLRIAADILNRRRRAV